MTEVELPEGSVDERELLLAWLGYLRGAVVRKLERLDEQGAHWRPEGRLLSLLGIVNHLTNVEWRWIDGGFLGEPTERREEEFTPGDELTVPDALARYSARAASSDRTVRSLASLKRAVSDRAGDGPALGAAAPPQRDRAARWARRCRSRALGWRDRRVGNAPSMNPISAIHQRIRRERGRVALWVPGA